jgi:predicted NAD/FAD-dependent oxidoreductase
LLAALAGRWAPAAARGLDRLWAQHFVVATQPSDLYVLSRPGETKLRLGATESHVRFLILCGDWTKTDLGCGCVEAATQSGMMAARALSNEPVYVWRPGF